MERASKDRREAFAILHQAGWSDGRIGRALRMNKNSVRNWRVTAGLAPNSSAHTAKIDDKEALERYYRGESDGQIARAFNATQGGVTRWRWRNNLPPNFERSPQISRDAKRRAKSMLRLGATKRQVANAIGASCVESIRKIRHEMTDSGLRRHGLTNRSIRARVLKDRTIYRRIETAIGNGLPSDVKCDAVDELYLAVLDGLVDEQFIEQEARRYRSRAINMNGSLFGPRSLDSENESGWSLSNLIEDYTALADMEEAASVAYGDQSIDACSDS